MSVTKHHLKLHEYTYKYDDVFRDSLTHIKPQGLILAL